MGRWDSWCSWCSLQAEFGDRSKDVLGQTVWTDVGTDEEWEVIIALNAE